MVNLHCGPLLDLMDRMRLEFSNQGSMFDLPARRWYLPAPGPDAPDLSVRFHGRVAGSPAGPAAGPQTQMAQNMVLAWLAGGRIMELKTVQVDDCLEISRPCIDAANIGYNIEFSQELRVQDALDQYVQGTMLIHMLRHAPAAFGHPFGDVDLSTVYGATIYDMSIGYDLEGIRSAKVRHFLDRMLDARQNIDRHRRQIPARWRELRDLDFPARLSGSVTLSTFHGCPADQIEQICTLLIREIGVDVVVKMNPSLLGRAEIEHLLHDLLGYHEVQLVDTAFTRGLAFAESIDVCRRLAALAHSRDQHFAVKFSNTLEVINHRHVFPAHEKVMYLSGPPLHVVTLALAHRFRQAIGADLPISFSAGVDRKNFANMVACGFAPVTTCTDLLKVGGYGRLPAYLHALQRAMAGVGAATVDDYILDARGQRHAGAADRNVAALRNTAIIVEETREDQRYRAQHNRLVPRRIDSHLALFDCITCDKCLPVCPNDANFVYASAPVRRVYRDVEVSPDGTVRACGTEKVFFVERQQQIANFADYCNHCGNCDTFCPEYDGPYLKKPSFFGSRPAFDEGAPHDGFLVEGTFPALTLRGRIGGRTCQLDQDADGGRYHYNDGVVTLVVPADDAVVALISVSSAPATDHVVDMGQFHMLVTLLQGVTSPAHVHPVNTRLLAAQP